LLTHALTTHIHEQGRFHTFIKDNYPAMRTTCSDLSPYYLAEARENVEYFTEFNATVNPGRALARTAFAQAAAEALPFADASFDVLMNVYLFHELPAAVRAAAISEFARVVKPGGIAIINDSLQRGDRPAMDAVMPLFPANYHEPYYMEYTQTDIAALFDAVGFDAVSVELAHVSKVWAFRRRG
jgi:ubiquinone/menaquinone biosynthesis C-methylase UbiE